MGWPLQSDVSPTSIAPAWRAFDAPALAQTSRIELAIAEATTQFFLEWVRDRMQRVKPADGTQLEEVFASHGGAEKFRVSKSAAADADWAVVRARGSVGRGPLLLGLALGFLGQGQRGVCHYRVVL